MSVAMKTKKLIDELKADHNQLVQDTLDLREKYQLECKKINVVIYRSFNMRNEKNRLRIDWQRVVFSNQGGYKKRQVRRISLGKTYDQSVKFMGRLDDVHLDLFKRYEPKLAKIRELADRNADARVALSKLHAAAIALEC